MTTPPTHRLETVHYNPDELSTYHRNPRRGDTNAIAESLQVNGQYRPIVVNLGRQTGRPLEVLAGNHTLAAARQLGWTQITATTIDVTDQQAARIVAADNRTADLGDYDNDQLAALLADLDDLSGTGYTDDDLDQLIEDNTDPDALTDVDDAPEPDPDPPTTKPGDIWHLGPHRLICGDATDPATLTRLTAGQKVDAWITDPPYNVDYTGGTPAALRIKNDKFNTEAAFAQFIADLAAAALPVTKPGAAFYTFHASTFQVPVHTGLTAAGIYISSHLVWVKNTFALSRSDYHWRHEGCIYGWNPAGPHTWYGDRTIDTLLRDDTPDLQKMTKAQLVALLEEAITASTVLYADKPSANREHPTMKPVALLTPLLENSTPIKGTVLDSTAGSGSIMIAAHHTGRTAYMVELDPVYCDVICRRWQEHTGQAPHRDGAPNPTSF